MARKKAAGKRQVAVLGKSKAKLLPGVAAPSRKPEPDALPPRFQKFLSLADETLLGEARQRSVTDIQPIFRPPKPPRLQVPKPAARRPQPALPSIKMPALPKAPPAPRLGSILPRKPRP